MKKICLRIAFDGTDYHGWQIQPDAPTIQGEIERHLATIHNGNITLHGAGRTDAGVHAADMVAHFQTDKNLDASSLKKSLNSMLPAAIRILKANEASEDFHSRFSATGKTYEYSFYNGEVLPPQHRLYTVHIFATLDFYHMNECCQMILGTHDFGCFETAGSRDPNAEDGRGSIRTITDVSLSDIGDNYWVFSVTGDGFLRHMVRNIVGTLFEVGSGRRSTDSFTAAFESKKRSEAGPTAPPHGLCLKKVHY